MEVLLRERLCPARKVAGLVGRADARRLSSPRLLSIKNGFKRTGNRGVMGDDDDDGEMQRRRRRNGNGEEEEDEDADEAIVRNPFSAHPRPALSRRRRLALTGLPLSASALSWVPAWKED